jgi:hypothetical protein
MTDWTREKIVEAVKEAAQRCNGELSMREFVGSIGIHTRSLYLLFPVGGWSEIRELAGLRRHPKDRVAQTDHELLGEFHRVVGQLGAIPSWHGFDSLASVSSGTVARRFGGRRGTLRRYRAWLQEKEPGSPLLSLVQTKLLCTRGAPHAAGEIPCTETPWAKGAGIVFGAPIAFRGVRHAPTNEQGVVYLFGMVSFELGFIVEAIQPGYPDCEAKRCVDAKLNRWQRVRIEFEFCSSNFREHGHDPAGCDLIVCWEHDWPECPLEVIQLRSVIDPREE